MSSVTVVHPTSVPGIWFPLIAAWPTCVPIDQQSKVDIEFVGYRILAALRLFCTDIGDLLHHFLRITLRLLLRRPEYPVATESMETDMLRTNSVIAGLVLSVVASSGNAVAAQPDQTNCTDRSRALSHLSKTYQEEPVAMGLASSGGVVEVLTNDKGSSWSIIVTLPTGVTCLVASGEGWEVLQPIVSGKHL